MVPRDFPFQNLEFIYRVNVVRLDINKTSIFWRSSQCLERRMLGKDSVWTYSSLGKETHCEAYKEPEPMFTPITPAARDTAIVGMTVGKRQFRVITTYNK